MFPHLVSLIALLNQGWHSETSLNEMKGKDELEHSIWENKARIPNGQRNSIPYKHIPGKQEGGSSLMNLGTVDISKTGSDLASLL